MPLLIVTFFIAMTAMITALNAPQQAVDRQTVIADATATSLLAYREGVINYLNANSGFSGVVTDALFTPLTGAVRNTRWTNVVSGGSLYVYETSLSNTPYILDQIYLKTNKSFMVGRNSSGFLVSANGIASGIAVPGVVPNGAVTIVGR